MTDKPESSGAGNGVTVAGSIRSPIMLDRQAMHEINNMIGAIVGSINLSLKRASDEQLYQLLQNALDSSHDLRKLLDGLARTDTESAALPPSQS